LAFHFISFSCSCPLEPYCKPFPRYTVSSTPLFFSLCKIFRTKDANSLNSSTIIVLDNIYIIHANKGRNLSTPPSAFHSDAFISAPPRSALLHPVFKPSTLQNLPVCSPRLFPSLSPHFSTSGSAYPPAPTPSGSVPTITKNTGGGSGGRDLPPYSAIRPCLPSSVPLFQVPYPVTPLFASLAKTAGCTPIIPIPRLTTRYSQFHPLGVSCG